MNAHACAVMYCTLDSWACFSLLSNCCSAAMKSIGPSIRHTGTADTHLPSDAAELQCDSIFSAAVALQYFDGVKLISLLKTQLKGALTVGLLVRARSRSAKRLIRGGCLHNQSWAASASGVRPVRLSIFQSLIRCIMMSA